MKDMDSLSLARWAKYADEDGIWRTKRGISWLVMSCPKECLPTLVDLIPGGSSDDLRETLEMLDELERLWRLVSFEDYQEMELWRLKKNLVREYLED